MVSCRGTTAAPPGTTTKQMPAAAEGSEPKHMPAGAEGSEPKHMPAGAEGSEPKHMPAGAPAEAKVQMPQACEAKQMPAGAPEATKVPSAALASGGQPYPAVQPMAGSVAPKAMPAPKMRAAMCPGKVGLCLLVGNPLLSRLGLLFWEAEVFLDDSRITFRMLLGEP